jgi:hypothetical protein
VTRRRIGAALIAGVPVAFVTLIAGWPWLGADFPRHLVRHVRWLTTRATGGDAEWSAHALGTLSITTPLPILALMLLGLVAIGLRWRRYASERSLHLMILAWLVMPILRVSVPYARDYDGMRHWMEVLPAIAILVGLGGGLVVERLRLADRPRARVAVAVALPLVAFGPTLVWNVRHHPDELLYYNALIGGLRGAHARGLADANDYWASSYRRGLAWIDANAGPDSFLVVGVGEHVVEAVADVRLRGDVRLLSLVETVKKLARREPFGRPDQNVFLMYVTRPAFYNELVLSAERGLTPVHEITADGVPILKIFRLQ